jgi:alkylation response protein AidB-like acyl-CoA dehydrogenase
MDFAYREEQVQLADAIRRWAARDYGFDARRAIAASPEGVSDTAWRRIAELGLTALPLPAAHGGFDGGAQGMGLVMQELGRALVVESYFATMLAAEALRLGGRHGELLERVAAGELRLACAFGERQSRHDLRDIATRAQAAAGGWVLHGEKPVVLHGAQAGMLLVSARLPGSGQRDEDGIALFVLPANSPNMKLVDSRMLDGMRAARVTLDGVPAGADALVGAIGQGWDILDAGADYGAALLCAESVGVMDALFAATLDYLKTRQQFGTPIGRFQALQHRMADMYMQLEQARSMALLAAVKYDAWAGGQAAAAAVHERRRAVSAAKYLVGKAARFVGQQAVQLHGGIGVTDELPAAHCFKRLTTIGLTLGDLDHHLARFIAQPGFGTEA